MYRVSKTWRPWSPTQTALSKWVSLQGERRTLGVSGGGRKGVKGVLRESGSPVRWGGRESRILYL